MKRQISSIKRENDRTKKAFLEEAISGQSTEIEFQSLSTEKPSEKSFYSIDKAIDCTPKVKDVKTQYSLSHCYHSISKKPAVKPTFVKIPPKRKTREASVNTDISFAPQENVIMETVSENISTESYHETDIEENESDSDPDYYRSSDGSESENFYPESLEETRKARPISDGTVFLVFWSCLTRLLQRCSIFLSPDIIERSFVKGTMILVDLLCKNQHRSTWRSQPINNGTSTGNINISAGILFSGNTFQGIK